MLYTGWQTSLTVALALGSVTGMATPVKDRDSHLDADQDADLDSHELFARGKAAKNGPSHATHDPHGVHRRPLNAKAPGIGLKKNGSLGVHYFDTYKYTYEEKKKKGSVGSIYNLAAAAKRSNNTDSGGFEPRVYVFNEYGEKVGFRGQQYKGLKTITKVFTLGMLQAGAERIEPKEVVEFDLRHPDRGEYHLFGGDEDDVCYSWISIADNLGRPKRGSQIIISGDWGYICGAEWYPATIYSVKGGNYEPKCFYIGSKRKHTGVQIRPKTFAVDNLAALQADPTAVCNGVDFGLRTKPIPEDVVLKKGPTAGKKTKPSPFMNKPSKRTIQEADKLIITDHPAASIAEVCGSSTSAGPDLVHTGQRMFCDMTNKIAYHFCVDGVDGDCYDFDQQALVLAGRGGAGPRAASGKVYETVLDHRWEAMQRVDSRREFEFGAWLQAFFL